MLRHPFHFGGGASRRARARRGARGDRSSRGVLDRVRLAFDVLEDRRMMSVTTPVETVYRDLVLVEVVDRRLFYNNSTFDGHSTAINEADDAAIAADKTALLPGGTATFANYSSYSLGINGLAIDIAGLPAATLDASDFEFRVGHSGDPAAWSWAPTPTSIGVRTGAGVSGSSRVEVVWADGAIQKQWLQVTLRATPYTGLKTADVFYFGNAVGETGNSGVDAIVDAVDAQGAQDNATNSAPVTSTYDFNRDGLVDATDASLATSNVTTAGTALQLLAAPAASASLPDERLQTSLFNWGDGGYAAIRIPALVTTNAGTVLAFADGRAGSQDATSYAMLVRRSTDGGATWSSPMEIYSIPPLSGEVISNGTPLVDKATGTVFLLFVRGTVDPVSSAPQLSDVYVVESTDDGLTWTAPRDITSSVKVTAGNNPGPAGLFPDTPWGWTVTGPGHGIQLQNGPHAGRLIVGGDHRFSNDISGKSWAHVIYSDDHGETWRLGGGLVGASDPSVDHVNDYSNENSLVELADGVLYMSIRVNRAQQHARGKSLSYDGGMTWTNMAPEDDLSVYQVEGSVLRLNDNVLLFSSPASTRWDDEVRHEMTIWASYDDGQNWTKRKVIFFGYAGYSDMTVVGPDTILLSFERGRSGGLGRGDSQNNSPDFAGEIGLARVNLRWLESDEPYEFNWYFNEQEPGAKANHSGSSIQDYGPWDQRAWARSSTASVAAQYVAGAGGDAAIQLTNQLGASGVVLSQAYNTALYASPDDSFTVQLMLKTTDTAGVIIGTRPSIRNWTLQIVDGKARFSLYDGEHTAVITSDAPINDGNWHHVAAVRDAVGRLLRLYVDHVEVVAAVIDTATNPVGQYEHVIIDPVYLGADNSLAAASKLDVSIDTLRFTRAALAPEKFFAADLAVPSPPPPPTYLPNAPTSLPGLKLWLPAYDPTRYFGDFGSFAHPLPLVPFDDMATRSMVEASANAFRVQTDSPLRQVLYAHDSVIGPYWVHSAKPGATSGSQWRVQNQNSGLTSGSLDFVQNTGVFTLSTFVNVGAATGGYMTIFDTNEGSNSLPGFSLFLQQNGLLFLSVTGGTAETVRFSQLAPDGAVTSGQWHHVAVVGNGPGNPIQFYVTPVSAAQVTSFSSNGSLGGSDGTYTTDLRHELFIGGRSNTQSPGAAPFNGGLVNEAIFDQALTPAQIQQLFLFGKGLTSAAPWQNPVEPLDVNGNGKIQASDALLLINRLLLNQGGELPAPAAGFAPPPYYDPTGNNILSAQDALRVINWLLLNPAASPTAAPLAEPAAATVDAEPLVATSTISTVPQFTLLSAPQSADSSALFTTGQSNETGPAAPSTEPTAKVLLVEPRYQAPAVDESSADVWLAADEFFGDFGRVDEEIGADEVLVMALEAECLL